jgi:hypothetical protein
MQLEWVKQQLQRHGLPSQRRRGVSAVKKLSAYVVAEAMGPSGCSCVLVSPTNSRAKEAALLQNTATQGASTSQDQSQRHLRRASAYTRHRVTLPGITPGTILRTRASVTEWMRTTRQLPSPEQYTVVMRDGRRVSTSNGSSSSNFSSLPSLPCRHARAHMCLRCPWMALQERQQAKAAKQKAWRVSLTDAVRNCWSTMWAKTHEQKELTCANEGTTSSQAPCFTYEDVMDSFVFLEPLAIPVEPHRLQALQLLFRRMPPPPVTDIVSSTSYSAPTPEVSVGGDTPSQRGGGRPLVDLLREGTAVMISGESGAASEAIVVDRYASPTQDDCLLETLEQKRLVIFLRRWAAQLPTSMQKELQGVFISQPSTAASSPPETIATHIDALQVVVVVKRNRDVLGMQSPLCSPANPADLLSVEEQELVGAVTASAPLLTDVEVLVCVRSDTPQESAKAAADACVHVLYPQLKRDAPIGELRRGYKEDSERAHGVTAATGKTNTHKGEAAVQLVQCWCEPLGKELRARLSPYHAALSAVPDTWLTQEEQRGKEGKARQAPPFQRSTSSIPVPWVPTFWRHPTALNLCCSVLLSMLLEGMEEHTLAKGGVEMFKGAMTPRSASVLASSNPLNISAHAMGESMLSTASATDVGAFAGQRILDTALQLLTQEVVSIHKVAGRGSLGDDGSGKEGCASPNTPQHVLLSVGEGSQGTSVDTIMEAVLTASLTQPVRVCLYSCTSTMKTAELGARVASIVCTAAACGRETCVRAGVIDVDPLSSSYVAYAQVDLLPPVAQ